MKKTRFKVRERFAATVETVSIYEISDEGLKKFLEENPHLQFEEADTEDALAQAYDEEDEVLNFVDESYVERVLDERGDVLEREIIVL